MDSLTVIFHRFCRYKEVKVWIYYLFPVLESSRRYTKQKYCELSEHGHIMESRWFIHQIYLLKEAKFKHLVLRDYSGKNISLGKMAKEQPISGENLFPPKVPYGRFYFFFAHLAREEMVVDFCDNVLTKLSC